MDEDHSGYLDREELFVLVKKIITNDVKKRRAEKNVYNKVEIAKQKESEKLMSEIVA